MEAPAAETSRARPVTRRCPLSTTHTGLRKACTQEGQANQRSRPLGPEPARPANAPLTLATVPFTLRAHRINPGDFSLTSGGTFFVAADITTPKHPTPSPSFVCLDNRRQDEVPQGRPSRHHHPRQIRRKEGTKPATISISYCHCISRVLRRSIKMELGASGEMNKNTTWCFMSCIPTTISRRRTKEDRHAMLGHDFIFCFRQMETLIADSLSLHRLSSSSPLTTATSLTLSATPWLPALSDTPPRSPAACPRPARRSETRSSPSSRSSTTTT